MDPLERLRGFRNRPERSRAIGDDVAAVTRSVRRLSAAAGKAAEAWEVVVPDEFRDAASIVELKRGVLKVSVPDSGVRFRLDRWLRGGGEKQLIAAARAPVSRVRLV